MTAGNAMHAEWICVAVWRVLLAEELLRSRGAAGDGGRCSSQSGRGRAGGGGAEGGARSSSGRDGGAPTCPRTEGQQDHQGRCWRHPARHGAWCPFETGAGLLVDGRLPAGLKKKKKKKKRIRVLMRQFL